MVNNSIVYFIQDDESGEIKIGTTKDLPTRLYTLRHESQHPLSVLGFISGGYDREAELHTQFANIKIRGEIFEPKPELLEFIKQNAIPFEEYTRPPTAKRDRSWDSKRSRATYDLPPELINRVRAIAKELGGSGGSVNVSHVARLLMETGLKVYESGDLEINMMPTSFKLMFE